MNAGFWNSYAFPNMNGALPLSNAGDKSTSLGIMPLFSKLNIPSYMSVSVMGGGSANGSSLKCFGSIRLGLATFLHLKLPMPRASNSFLLIAP